jgi:ribose/xylose/arabinose/galactoside ABC-type transport system permease subunit
MRNIMQTSSRENALRSRLRASLVSQVSRLSAETLRRHWADYVLVAVLLGLVVYTASTQEAFFTQRNLSNLLRKIAPNGLISLGMLVVILTGGIDLSVGSVVALAAILSSGLQHDMPLSLAILIALLAGVAAGLINGVLVARFKLAPFIVTLATLGAIRGLVYVYSDTPQSPINPDFRQILGGFVGGFVGPVAVATVIMLACYPLVWLFLNRPPPDGPSLLLGESETVRLADQRRESYCAGLHDLWLLLALAGVLAAARLGIAQPSLGSGYELDAIAAAVIGVPCCGGGGGRRHVWWGSYSGID